MIIIRKITSFLCLIGCFLSCNSVKKSSIENLIPSEDCFKLYNQNTENSIQNFYSEDVKNQYENFKLSSYDVDIILIQTSYGYDVNQEFNRLYLKGNEVYTSSIGIDNKRIPKEELENLLALYNFKDNKSLYINCKETSSKSLKIEFFINIKGKQVFSFHSNQKINDLDLEISKDELTFLKKYMQLFN